MTAHPLDEEAIFHAAREIESPQARTEYLASACDDNPALLARVEALLKVYVEQESLAGIPPEAIATIEQKPLSERPGTMIGSYKLLEQIGEGGMGTVFMAEQIAPVQRRVALKIIKPGMDSRQVIARFAAEKQTLALMDHVNIARVLDAGATEHGRPYFVMELVHGVPITKYCDENHLTPRQRLELFVPVCQAIQHAHQKGIIHRDIKPSNVMITLYDGKPVPKVIDFGVAKAMDQKLTEQTLFTQYGTMVGTLEYMSPEQAEMSAMGIDTRSDIYSLGVLLYELLTGSTPLSRKQMNEAAYGEILRLIKEEEPPKPSTRLSESGEALASISAQRQTEPAKLSKLMRGELDWIVMKTLEKDRNRRYETANGLALDVQRYLVDEPVLACPPSAGYRLRKFARRNRTLLAAGGAVVAALVIGLGLSTWLFFRERAAAGVADANALMAGREAARADQLRRKAEANEQRATSEAAKSQLVAQFMTKMLNGVGPAVALGRDTTLLREILDQTVERLIDLEAQPAVEADLRATLGNVYSDLGDYESAAVMHRKALALRKTLHGSDHPNVASSLNDLAEVEYRKSKYPKAEALHREALAMRRTLLGEEHVDVATSLNNLAETLRRQDATNYAAAELLHREALRIRRKLLGNEHPDVARSLTNLGQLLISLGKHSEAEVVHREALAARRTLFGQEHPDVATSLDKLGMALKGQGRDVEAEAVHNQALAMRRKLFGNEHPDVAHSIKNLADVYESQGRLTEAETLLRQSLIMRTKILGDTHRDTQSSLNRLIRVLQKESILAEGDKKLDEEITALRRRLEDPREAADSLNFLGRATRDPIEAERLHREALAMQKTLGEHPDMGVSLIYLGWALRNQGKLPEAETALRESLEVRTKLLGKENTVTAGSMTELATVLAMEGKLPEAEAQYREALAMREKLHSGEEPWVFNAFYGLADVLRMQHRERELVEFYGEELAAQRRQFGDEHPAVANLLHKLGDLFRDLGKWPEAEAAFREALAMRRKLLGKEHLDLAHSLHGLAWVLNHEGKRTEAEALSREELAMRRKLLGNDHPDVASTLTDLATFLRDQGKLDEAAVVLRELVSPSELLTNALAAADAKQWDQSATDFARAIDGLEDTPSWNSPRKNACRELARWTEVFDRVVELRPKEMTIWIGRAQFRALRSQWAEAASDYAKVINARPIHNDSLEYAGVLLLAADNEGYQQFCRELAARPGEPKDAYTAYIMTRACALGPADAVEPARLVQWANQAAEDQPVAWRLCALGLAHCRSGEFDRAIQDFDKSNELSWNGQAKAQNWLGLSLAYYRRGETEKARKCLKTAQQMILDARPSKPDEPAPLPAGDWISLHVMLREAEKLLLTDDGPTTTDH